MADAPIYVQLQGKLLNLVVGKMTMERRSMDHDQELTKLIAEYKMEHLQLPSLPGGSTQTNKLVTVLLDLLF